MTMIREFETTVSWDARLIGIMGSRGTGKTTLMLQHMKKTFGDELHCSLYLSLDNIWFADNRLVDIADYFVKRGGTHLFLDEVHRYPFWSTEIKNLYDEYPSLHVVFTGSSLLELSNARGDLSRRALVYELSGFSFREYLNFELGLQLPSYSLDQMFADHTTIAEEILQAVPPYAHFDSYLEYGYYPYYREGIADYSKRVEQALWVVIEQELVQLRNLHPGYVRKVKQLLAIIADSAPFTPNVSKLSERIGINRQTFITYLSYLEEARVLRLLHRDARGISLLAKPEKIMLDNTNLMAVLGSSMRSKGSVRQTFLASQLGPSHRLAYPPSGDFIVDGRYTIEVGGKSKDMKQIAGIDDAYVAKDGIEVGWGSTIPLYLFGFVR